MAKPSVDISLQELEELAYKYIDECQDNFQEFASAGKAVKTRSRHIPTVQFFLRIWIPKQGKPGISRSSYYSWLDFNPGAFDLGNMSKAERERFEAHLSKLDTIKKIDNIFKALAEDIVANEGKGIFYAKNRLGMTDRTEISGNPEQPLFSK